MRFYHYIIKLITINFLIVFTAAHASMFAERQKIDSWLEKIGGTNSFDETKTVDWGLLPGPFYTPEMSAGVGVALVGLYRIDRNDKISQPSSLSLSGFASATGAFGLNFNNYNFLSTDQWRLFISGTVNNIPTYYWGKGYSAGKNNHNKVEYRSQEFAIKPRVLYCIIDNIYIGVGWDFSSLNASDLNDRGKNYFAKSVGRRSILSSGISAYFNYDSRDFLPNAQQGQALEVIYSYFSPELASNNRFQSTQLQYSVYYSLSENSVLALDNYARFTSGSVPWDHLSLLGNTNQMRGYYEGRYRDNNVFTTQLEYRRKLDWRHGIVSWIGVGTLSDSPSKLGSNHWLPTVGIGYRFEFKPRMNIRLDFGVGRNSIGFYFQVGEAF